MSRLLDRAPGPVRVEPLHLRELVERRRAEIFLVDHAVVTDDEGLEAGDAIRGRRGHQREAPDHHLVHHEVQLAERCRRSLPLQNLEEVPAVRLGPTRVALFDRARDGLADRAIPAPVRLPPREAVLCAWSADDALGVLGQLARTEPVRVLVLRLHIPAGDLDRIQLVATDAAVAYLLPAGLRIEGPPRSALDDRDRERPVTVAHQQERSRSCPWRYRDARLLVRL